MSQSTNQSLKVSSIDECRRRFLIVGILGTFLLSFTLSMYLDTTTAPDEETRFLLPLWILNNHRLPYGNEVEIMSPYWGMSYAYRPYLLSILSFLNMRLVSFFQIVKWHY